MADEAQKRKAVAEKINWLNRPYAAYTAHVEKQRKLFEAANAYITQEGGWVVSPPGDKRLRIESPQDGGLPIRLAERGFVLRYIGTGTRNVSSGIIPTDIIEITLRG
jgi:hypothetical protein